MEKKEYLKPVMKALDSYADEEILAGSVTTTGLGEGENLELLDDTPKDAWESAW